MNITERIKPWLKKKPLLAALMGVLLVLSVAYFSSNSDTSEAESIQTKTIVKTTTPSEYIGGQSLSLIGSVRAFSEAEITSERAGRITSVNVSLGQQVSAGAVIATLENASERAAVLQAEGVYDAAVAASAQSDVGVTEARTSLRSAQNSAVSNFKSTYNTTNGIVLNSIDTFFSNPNNQVPGLRIDGRGFTSQLNSDRVGFQTLLPEWQSRVNEIDVDSDLYSEIEYASRNVQSVIDMIDTFLLIFSQQDNSSRYSESELIAFSNTFTGLRSTLIGVQSSLNNSVTSLNSAEDAIERSELSSAGGATSASDAQIKQALGALRSAQANLAKTILRTPISGTVNSISVRTGDFVSSFSKVGIVANNDAFEIVTYISDTERSLLSENDTVTIDGKYEGTVTKIAPAVDTATRKTEVRIATEGTDIVNGDTVRITKDIEQSNITSETIQIPLTAVKFDRENGSVFVIENDTLVSKAVVLGKVLGSSVEVLEGISMTDEFVTDARGLVAGESVEVAN